MTTITGNARFREAVAARLVLAMRPDQSIADTAVPDAQSSPTPGDYSIQVDTHQVLLQAHAFDPANLIGPWRAETVFAVGDVIFETGVDAEALILECTAVTGTEETGATEPTWDTTPGNTTTDNDVTWETLGAISELSPITQFLYSPVLVLAVTPEIGPVGGGATITITGSGFSSGGSASVSVGGNAATNVTVVSDSEINCDTPSGTQGGAEVTVTVGGETATLLDGFYYASYEAEVLSDSPLAYWRLDETSGAAIADASGNSRGGSISGTYSLGSPALITNGSSIGFSNANVTFADISWMPSGSNEMSVEGWALPNTVSDGVVFAYGDPNVDGAQLNLGIESDGSGDWYMIWRHNGGNVSYGPISKTTPTHWVFVVPPGATDTDDPYMIINGVTDIGTRTGGFARSLALAQMNLRIGKGTTGDRAFDGRIDEVAIYDCALPEDRAAAHYQAGAA